MGKALAPKPPRHDSITQAGLWINCFQTEAREQLKLPGPAPSVSSWPGILFTWPCCSEPRLVGPMTTSFSYQFGSEKQKLKIKFSETVQG